MKGLSFHIFLGSLLLSRFVLAEAPSALNAVQYNAEQENSKSRKNYVQRFIKFTQDQNVAGKPKDPNGKVVQGGQKNQFNRDDGNSFQGALTYHDAAFTTDDEQAKQQNPNDPKAQTRQLAPFVSSHGGVSAAGGSSQLERTVYEKHTALSKKDEDPKQQQQQEKQKGVKFFSVFKRETLEVQLDPKKPDQVTSVSRVSLRPEVKEAVEQVGLEAFKTVEQTAKDPGAENNAKAMGNLTFYREAVARASKALWDSTLANLSQRRLYQNGGNKLVESGATCDAWAQQKSQEISQIKDPEAQKAAQEDLKKQTQKCQQMAQTSWKAIDPSLEEDKKGSGLQLKEKGPNREDGYSRDLRNQLEVMDKVGLNPDQLKSNWKYNEEEFTNEIVTGMDDSGQVTTTPMTNAEQLEEYNNALDESIASFKQLKAGVPEIQFDESALEAKKIKPGEQNLTTINQTPSQMLEELGAKATPDAAPAQNYSELIQEQQSGSTPAP